MTENNDKPSPEAKALSLYLMAFKGASPAHKEKSTQMKKLWTLVITSKLSKSDYLKEVQKVLTSYGGYTKVIEDTVHFYIKKTGQWKLNGDDKYCIDAKEIAAKILGE